MKRTALTILATGHKGILETTAVTHAGMTTQAFASTVAAWLGSAHPRFNQPYDMLVYQPQLELLAYLRQNGFKTFIVSGGGVEFMRVFAERTYGIPPEQVVGSSVVEKLQLGPDAKPELIKEPKAEFIDDGPGKPVGINRFIGPPSPLRLRQLGRRSADAGMDRGRRRRALHGARAPYRR